MKRLLFTLILAFGLTLSGHAAVTGNLVSGWRDFSPMNYYTGAYTNITLNAATTWTYLNPTDTAKINRPWTILCYNSGVATLGFAFPVTQTTLSAGDLGAGLAVSAPPILLGPFAPGMVFAYKGVTTTGNLWMQIIFQ